LARTAKSASSTARNVAAIISYPAHAAHEALQALVRRTHGAVSVLDFRCHCAEIVSAGGVNIAPSARQPPDHAIE
jgi:hypothetical protein